MALLTGLTDQGVEVPVQVSPAGVLVAEGLQGPPGADGNNGAAEVGSNYVILQGAGTARVMGCWGEVISSDADFAHITFPRPFTATPALTVTDADKTGFANVTAYHWQLRTPLALDGAEVECIAVPGGGPANGHADNRRGLWVAWGPVA